MRVEADDYQQLRGWFAYMARETFPTELSSSETDPIAHLDQLASRSPAKAREGLAMAINDTVEMTDRWPQERVAATDLSLQQHSLPTLTEMRGRFSKLVHRAVRQGHINDDVEYHAVRNAAELAEGKGEGLWALLAA
jgi:hypothetical protein